MAWAGNLEHSGVLVDGDRHAQRLAQGQPPVGIIDQDLDREVSGLGIGDPADELDLPLLPACLGGG